MKGLLLVLLLLLVSEVVVAAAKAARRPELARAVRASELTVSDSMISTVVSVDVWRKNNPDPMVLDLLRDCMRTVEKNKARK